MAALGESDPPDGFVEEALFVDTFVEHERGQWVVYMEVGFWSGTVRHRIQTYRSERLALIAADYMRRAAQRNLRRPPSGL